jgi:hypothetical protein
MGRQVQISMMPDDVEQLLTHLKSQHRIVVVKRDDFDSADVKPLKSVPTGTNETLILWNLDLLPRLHRRLISRENDADYYRVDEFAQPVLEFSGSSLVQWCDRPSLTQGRIYGTFENKHQGFVKWYEQIVRYIRKSFVRNPANVSGYVGPAAYKWFRDGGLLLPTFLPPVTDSWRKFFAEEDLVRRRLNEASGISGGLMDSALD